ncbi:UDP-Glycosyltransferase/glycogen phosphorylase [Aspergillus falconensis]
MVGIVNTEPIVVIACPPENGHTHPLLPHATHLVKQGYIVHFIAGAESEYAIRRTGAVFHPLHRDWPPGVLEKMMAFPDPTQRFNYALGAVFVDLTPVAMKVLQDVLEAIREEYPQRDVVIVEEFASAGVWPFVLGAPLPKGYARFPKVITFSTLPFAGSSVDTAPFRPGLPPDSSEAGRARNAALYESFRELELELVEHANAVYQRLGATKKAPCHLLDLWATGADLTVQPCSPSLEYPRSDLSPKVRFIGGTPRAEVDPQLVLPEWWGELLEAKKGDSSRKIVFVSQGTVMVDYNMLLLPTIEALADREDCMVIGVLGQRGAKLEGVMLPANAKVVDYLLYAAILPYVDVFINNGGYGGFMQGIMHGVPMVLAGVELDKAEVSMRGEWAGIAINLRTSTPSAGAIRDGVDKILADGSFKARCVKIQRENEELDCRAQLERLIAEIV